MTQQLVIAAPEGADDRALWRFALQVGGTAAGAVALLLPFGLPFYFSRVVGIRGSVLSLAMDAVMLLTALPVLVAQQQYWQGVLVRARATWAIIVGSSANLVTLAALGFLAVMRLPWPAVDAVAMATLAGYAAELGVLARATRSQAELPRLAPVGT